MSIKNQHADQLEYFPGVANRENFINNEVEVLLTFPSFGPWYAYKVKRKEQTSVIRIFPFSIQSNYAAPGFHKDFLTEMERIATISKEPFGYIVPISNWGITSQGSYPYVESYDDTDQKLESVTSNPVIIKPNTEVIKMAEHLSRTLAICHNVGMIHGAISVHSIKLKPVYGQYFLDDFGASILNNEQRRTLDNHASKSLSTGIVSSNGIVSFQSDVFAIGKVLYYFLTGVHYTGYATDKNEFLHLMNGLRNHLENGTTSVNTSVEDIPEWLGQMIYTCLHPDTADCFSNGIELYDHVLFNQLRSSQRKVQEPEIALPGNITRERKVDNPTPEPNKKIEIKKRKSQIKKVGETVTLPVVILLVSFVVVASLFLFAPDLFKPGKKTKQVSSSNQKRSAPPVITDTKKITETSSVVTTPKKEIPSQPVSVENSNDAGLDNARVNSTKQNKNVSQVAIPANIKTSVKREGYTLDLHTGLGSYQVKSKAYFHTKPDESTRRDAHIVHWNNAILKPIEATNDFVYIIFTNHWGQTSKGWLRKKDLRQIEVE